MLPCFHRVNLGNWYFKGAPLRILYLTADSYGGYGGIAQYNINFIEALALMPETKEVVVLPRMVSAPPGPIPDKVRMRLDAGAGKMQYKRGGKLTFMRCLASEMIRNHRFDLIICAHINLLPLSQFLGRLINARITALTYGIEAWTKPANKWCEKACRRLDHFISIRRYTASRIIEWAEIEGCPWDMVPNCIDIGKYGKGEKNLELLARYGLEGKRIILTVGRLDPSEINKGFDEVIEVMPHLISVYPDLRYLIVGEGVDQRRLEQKTEEYGVRDKIVFTGRVTEEEKVEHFRLGDVFVMAGTNPDFDLYPLRFVFLEAMACGLPVVGSRPLLESEAKAPETQMMDAVDPNDKDDFINAILRHLQCPVKHIPDQLKDYGKENHNKRVADVIRKLMA